MSSKTKTTATKEEATPALVPKLRFPEFHGAWEQRTIETLGYFTGGGTPSKDNAAYWTGDIPWISSSDLHEDSISKINISRFITKQAVQESATKLVPAKSILLISRVGVGKLAVSTFPLCTSQDFTNFTPTDADPLFLAYLLKSQKETLLSFNQGTSIKGFTKDNIASLRLGFPSPAEQQKIAECLSSVDELMAAQARKVDALKTHKKGLMQQLFPREGDDCMDAGGRATQDAKAGTQPRLRFPEFQNTGEWVVKPLGEIFPITSSKRVHESDWTPTGVPFYRAREIVALNKHESVQPLFISEELYAAYSKQTGAIRDGHLLVTGVGSIGVPYLVRTGDRFYFKDGNIIWLKNDGKELSGEFLLRLYETDYVQKQLKAMADVGTVATYTIDNAKRTLAAFPKDTDEQQLIADCLTSLDALITAETQKLEALKIHKKGLMQQLFPILDEVQG